TYADPVASAVAGQRYTLTTPAPSPASPITVSGAATITGTYKVQFQLTFVQSGIGADSTGTAVTVAGNPKTAGDLPFSAFYDAGGASGEPDDGVGRGDDHGDVHDAVPAGAERLSTCPTRRARKCLWRYARPVL